MQMRTSLLIDRDAHDRFKAVCKALGCSQADYIAATTLNPNLEALKPVIDSYLAGKLVGARTPESAMIAKLKAMSPEQQKAQLAALAAAIAE
jgi:hypothetical protein